MNLNGPLTWDEIAELFDQRCGSQRKARTLPMEKVFSKVSKLPEIAEKRGMLYRRRRSTVVDFREEDVPDPDPFNGAEIQEMENLVDWDDFDEILGNFGDWGYK